MGTVLSVNVGQARDIRDKRLPTGIDKRPVDRPVMITDPGGPKGVSGVEGDTIGDSRHHGGRYQAVYAYAAEDLAYWEAVLERPLGPGVFGENLTVEGVDVTGAVIGERWRIGAELVLQVTEPRIPCSTFRAWMGLRGWVRTFTKRAVPGAYLSVVEPGSVRAGDEISVIDRPGHGVTIGVMFRALTLEPQLLPRMIEAGEDLPEEARRSAIKRAAAKEVALPARSAPTPLAG